MLERSHAIGSCTDTETGTNTDVLYSSSTVLQFYTTGTSVGPGRLVSTTAAVLVSVSCDRSRYIGKKNTMDREMDSAACADVIQFLLGLLSRLAGVLNNLQHGLYGAERDLPPLAHRPPHRDSDIVTSLQWLHLQTQNLEECQSLGHANGRSEGRSEVRRERSLGRARRYLRHIVEGYEDDGRLSPNQTGSMHRRSTSRSRSRGPYPPSMSRGLGWFRGNLD